MGLRGSVVLTQIGWTAALLLCAAIGVPGCGGRSISNHDGVAALCRYELDWQVEFSGERNYALDVALPSDDGIVLAGRRFAEGREWGVVLELDSGGEVAWETHLEQEGAVLLPWGDGFFVAGSRPVPARNGDVVLTLFDWDGNPVWEAVTGTDDDDHPRTIVTLENAIAIIGSSARSASPELDVFVSVIEATGQLRWTRTYGERSNQLGAARDEFGVGGMSSSTGELIVAAMTWIDGGHGPLWLFALDAAGGVIWEHVDEVVSNRPNSWPSTRTRDGGMVLAGSLAVSGTTTGGSARVVRLNARGVVEWTTRLSEGDTQQGVSSIIELEGGGFAAVGHYSQRPAGTRLWQLGADGVHRSTDTIEHEAGPFSGLGHVREAPSGGFWLGGSDWGVERPDLLRVVRVDAQGTKQWVHEIQGVGVASLSALEVLADGRVLAVGHFADDARQSHVVMIQEVCDSP